MDMNRHCESDLFGGVVSAVMDLGSVTIVEIAGNFHSSVLYFDTLLCLGKKYIYILVTRVMYS